MRIITPNDKDSARAGWTVAGLISTAALSMLALTQVSANSDRGALQQAFHDNSVQRCATLGLETSERLTRIATEVFPKNVLESDLAVCMLPEEQLQADETIYMPNGAEILRDEAKGMILVSADNSTRFPNQNWRSHLEEFSTRFTAAARYGFQGDTGIVMQNRDQINTRATYFQNVYGHGRS